MKKIISMLTMMAILLTIITLSSVNVFAAASASLIGPSEVRAGDTITLTYRISPNNLQVNGVSGELSFDSSQVSLSSTSSKVPSSWLIDWGSKTFSAYDNSAAMNKYITANNTQIFTATFKIASGVQPGTKISISVRDTKISRKVGNNYQDDKPGTITYSVTVAQPKSSNNNLSSLNVSNASISPAFNKDTTKYTASVDYSVSKLNVTGVADDSKAKVSVSGESLSVGKNTVNITVTAENGSKKTYQITVTRAQDPNYKPSTDTKLSSISLSKGILSPAFKADTIEYIAYLPYEVSSIDIGGTLQDSKAKIDGNGQKTLEVGENKIIMKVTAEDGITVKEYTVNVMRMPELNGSAAIPTTPSPSPSIENTDTPSPTPSETATVTSAVPTNTVNIDDSKSSGSLDLIWILLLCIISAGVGFGICYIIFKKQWR